MKIRSTDIPNKYREIYSDSFENYTIIFNPLSKKGVIVLNKEAAYIYSLVDNRRSVNDIFTKIRSADPSESLQNLLKTIESFLKNQIIYIDTPINERELFSKMPGRLGIWFHMTNQCNFRCTYCYVPKTPENMSMGTLDISMERIFASAVRHHFKFITFKFAGGEPLLELAKIIRAVKLARRLAAKHKMRVGFTILTNGSLLSDATCKILRADRIQIAVSFDGIGKFHDATRIFSNGSGTFSYVEKGLKNALKYRIPCTVTVTITAKNIKDIPQVTAYLLASKVPFTFNFYRENPLVKEDLNNDTETLIRYLKQAYALIDGSFPHNVNNLLDRVDLEPHRYPCGVGRNYLVVKHNGQLIRCPMTQSETIGSIYEMDPVGTMQSSFGAKPANVPVELKSKCKRCLWRYNCAGGCPILTNGKCNKYNAVSPYCTVYKALIPELIRIEASRLVREQIPLH